MHTDDVAQLSARRLVLTVVETMKTLTMTETFAAAALERVHAACPAETQLLYTIVVSQRSAAADTTTTATLCVGDEEADKVLAEALANTDGTAQKHLYGLQRLTSVSAASAPPATTQRTTALRLARAPQLRTYPLATREAIARGEHAPAVAPAVAAAGAGDRSASILPASTVPAAAAAVPKREPVKAEVTVKHEADKALPTTATATASIPFVVKTEPKAVEEATPVPAPVAAVKARVESAPVATPAAASPASPTTPPARRQSSLFDMMMKGSKAPATTASAEASEMKRPRAPSPVLPKTAESPATSAAAAAPATKKRKAEGPAKAAKKPKEITTHSLAKLAKASGKATGGASASSKATPAFDFDEEATESESSEEQPLDGEGFLSHEVFNEAADDEAMAGLDLEVTAVNDEIILCDDAAPLAFREPVRVSAAHTAATTAGTARHTAEVNGGVMPTPQRRLSTFFNSEVVAVQSQYVKEVHTDMRVEGDEYVCVDVIAYRHKQTGEVITEDAFHQLSADVMTRQAEAAARSASESQSTHSPSKEAGTEGSSPAAGTAGSGKRANKMKVAKPVTEDDKDEETATEKPAVRPTRNLLSFFKQ